MFYVIFTLLMRMQEMSIEYFNLLTIISHCVVFLCFCVQLQRIGLHGLQTKWCG